jgi:hypothetical protein
MVEAVEMRRNGLSKGLTSGLGAWGARPVVAAQRRDDEMILALIGSVGFLLAMSVGWSWLEARQERRGVADS